MIDVTQGQTVVVASRHGAFTTIAHTVTAKQIRTLRHGRRYSVTERDDVVFAGERAKAELVAEAINAAEGERRERDRGHRDTLEAACAPFVAAHDANIASSRERYEADVAAVLAAATGPAVKS